MNFKTIFFAAGCAIVAPLVAFAVLTIVLLGLLIESPAYPSWAREKSWEWMLGTPQAVIKSDPPLAITPIIAGTGNWCITKAYLQSPTESHLNAGRVQGYVRDAFGQPMAGVPVRVEWDGCGGDCITEYTRADGYYVAILGPGEYRITVGSGQSQTVTIRTNMREYYGHYTWDVDFKDGCGTHAPASGGMPAPSRAPTHPPRPTLALEPLR
jgi:hypothetical protein